MKRTSKWPSRAFNLLMVLAMVISLSAILVAPPIVAGAAPLPCNPTPNYAGCHLVVAVSTYIKDAEGNFQPKGNFTPGDCFYVNAVVVNDGNATAVGPINATISWIDKIGSADGIEFAEGQGNLTTWIGNLTGSFPPGAGAIADFWWHVCCLSADGNNTISVNATLDQVCDQPCPAIGYTWVDQTVTEEHPCLEIEIVEAPGMSDRVGHLLDGEGDPIVYHSPLLNTVGICQNFGIKAEITNNCNFEIHDLNGTISWNGDPASMVGNDPYTWPLADPLLPGQTVAVAWTLHCDGAGDVHVKVNATGTAESVPPIIGNLDVISYGNNTWTVHQASQGGVTIDIISPKETTDCAGITQIYKQANGCGSNKFLVVGNVTNTGDNPLGGVLVQVFATPSSGWVTLPLTTWQAISLAPHEWKLVTFGNFTCIGLGLGNITMTASPTGLPTVSDFVTIDQKNIIATISPPVIQAGNTTPDWPIAYVNPSEVNKCQTFGVAFRYSNYTTGVPWDLSNGNITACINWQNSNGDDPSRPNAAFTGQIWYRRIETGQAAPWQLLPGLSPEAQAGNLTDISGQVCNNITATQSTPVICPCCAVDVLWVFQCLHAAPCYDDTEDVEFNSTITVQQTAPPSVGTIYGNDTSPSVCVDQVWKAHLTGDVLFFLQDDNGNMTVQGAVVPGTEFHVVIPVINTGDATAENVQVYFYTTTGNATIGSYTVLSYSGDGSVSYTYNPVNGQGTGIASLGNITGHSAKKAILLVRCNSEGELDITIPTSQGGTWASAQGLSNALGIRGTDKNTGTWVPQANIVVPNCPEVIQQIPFTVQILNPITCQTFNEGDVFPVKALIHNGSSAALGLADVFATIHIVGNATLVDPQDPTGYKFVGNMTPLSYSEITWMLRCTGGGDVDITVTATLPEPLLRATSAIVTVHQIAVSHPELNVTIMSPQDSFGHQPPFADIDGTYIGTGEQFAVTALITNSGDGVAHDVQVVISANESNYDNLCVWTNLGQADGNESTFYIEEGCVTPGSVIVYFNENFDEAIPSGNYSVVYNLYGGEDQNDAYTQITFNSPPADGTDVWAVYLADFKLIDGLEIAPLGDIAPGGYATYTWTMVATSSCDEQCTTLPFNIDVAAIASDPYTPVRVKGGVQVDSLNFTYDCDEIDVFIYPAAHLVVDITPPNPNTISVCDEFTVGYTVTNIGQSDAWNASVTLSVDPAGSVRIAAGDTGYTKLLGTITGTLTSPDNSVSGNFTLHCKLACESTITITPMGYDECGYGPVMVQTCESGGPHRGGGSNCWNDYMWEGVPGTAIQGKFLQADSTTVKQVENGLDVAITKRADKGMAGNGTAVQFTVRVTNNGPIAGSGIVVTDSWTTSGFTSPAVVSKSQGSAPVFTADGFTWNVGGLAVNGTATLVYSAVSHSNAKIVNTATVASAEGDGYPSNNTASVEFNVASMDFALRAGWNLISLPLIPGNTTTEAVLASLKIGSTWTVNKVWGYSATTGWSSRIPGVSGTLTQMTDGWGYWIYMNSAQTLTITGTELPVPPSAGGQPPVPPSYDVVPGWNLIGFKSTTAKPEGVYLAAIAGVYTKVYGFSQGLYFTVVSGDNLQPGMGYWIAIVPPGGTIFP